MRYPYLIALAIFLAMPTVSTPADEPTADQRLKPRPLRRCGPHKRLGYVQPSGVFSEDGLARFRLLSGRIEVDPMRYRKGTEEHSGDEFSESITVSAARGVPSVYYSFRDQYQRIQLVAEHGQGMRIESTLIATGEQGILEQRGDGSIAWSTRRDPVDPSELDQAASGRTLLHIVGQDEAGFETHVEGLITRMLRGRSLIELTRRTEQVLQDHSSRHPVVASGQVNELIDQLRSPKSSNRRAAANKLAQLGTTIVPYLSEALRRDDLDIEQVSRIRSLIARNPRIDEDTPSSLACLLSTDRHHWQIMAKRMDREKWIAANDHIRRCGLDALSR